MIPVLAMIVWVVATIGFFVLQPRRPLRAAALSIIGGAMFLPCGQGLKLPVLPNLDKDVFPALLSLLLAGVFAWPRIVKARPGRGPDLFLAVMILGALVTNLLNRDPLVLGGASRPGNTPLDTVNDALEMLVRWWAPFFIGRALVSSERDVREVLLLLALGGAIYVPLFFLELRIAPVLHKMIYGYHPSDFSQVLRFGGVRPVILMVHGLVTSAFMLYATLAALALARGGNRILGLPLWPLVAALLTTVVLCKSVGVWVFAALTVPLLLVASPRLQIRVAVCIAIATLSYPLIREADLVPTREVVAFVSENVSAHHAHSLSSRWATEDDVLARLRERPLFGWGGYGRYQAFDRSTGRSLSIMDGLWIIKMGEGGLVRFLSIFGLLLYPVIAAWWHFDRIRAPGLRRWVAALAVIVALRCADMLPNSPAEGYLTLLSGVLLGAVGREVLPKRARRRAGSARGNAGVLGASAQGAT